MVVCPAGHHAPVSVLARVCEAQPRVIVGTRLADGDVWPLTGAVASHVQDGLGTVGADAHTARGPHEELVISGYSSLTSADTNSDKDVYLITLSASTPPDDDGDDGDNQEPPVDEPAPVDDPTPGIDDSNNDAPGEKSSSSCSYDPEGCFDPVFPSLIIIALIVVGWKLRKYYR